MAKRKIQKTTPEHDGARAAWEASQATLAGVH